MELFIMSRLDVYFFVSLFFILNGIISFQDKQTDRCYAAKHIRIRKPEQKEKVEHSDEKKNAK